MDRHPYFNLLLHSDAQLAGELGAAVANRITLHEWPLSCVQRLTLENGDTWIYKATWGPTVEADFYAAASSPLLVTARVLYRDDGYTCLLLADQTGPRLSDAGLTETDALESGRILMKGIAAVQGSPAVYLDISTWERWGEVANGMLEGLNTLIKTGSFHSISPAALPELADVCQGVEVRRVIRGEAGGGSGLVHNDLRGDNVLMADRQYRVIDWQRPISGPVELDLAKLLGSLGYDPRPYVAPGILTINDLLHIHWFVECSLRWFPPGIPDYEQVIAGIAARL